VAALRSDDCGMCSGPAAVERTADASARAPPTAAGLRRGPERSRQPIEGRAASCVTPDVTRWRLFGQVMIFETATRAD